ncbi:MAG: M48 family metalloprotease [Terracidiphilus sp.]
MYRLSAFSCLQVGAALIFLVLLPLCLHAQDSEDDDDDSADVYAYISLRYNAHGDASVYFHANREIQNWGPVEAAIDSALHCEAGNLTHPPPRPLRQHPNLSAQQEANLQKYAELGRRQTWQGECPGAMAYNGLLLSTELNFAPLLTELDSIGEHQLWVNVGFPESRYSQYTPSNATQYNPSPEKFLSYRFGGKASAPSFDRIHLEFGLRKQDAIRSAAFPLAFLLLPILVVLWAQRAALRDARIDPTSAWFSYFRVLTWCAYCLLVIWMLGQGVRQGLETLFTYQLAAGDAGAVALGVAIFMLPPWTAYLICVLSSYRVYVHVRGETWTKREFLANQLLDVATQMLPLMCLLAGTGMMNVNMRASMALFIGVYVTYAVCVRLKVKVSGIQLEPLSTGELRDRVFDLAKQAAVEIRQVFIMPAGKSQMANAFASRNKMVIFTDFLLNRLNKREVSAIAAHEITHIQKKHGSWKLAGLVGLVLSTFLFRGILNGIHSAIASQIRLQSAAGFPPQATEYKSGLIAVHGFIGHVLQFPELDLVFYTIGFLLFLLQSRAMERSADTGAVRLTQDPEAVISGLLKLGRLNLLPNQWGSLTGPLLTHPSTLKRVERVARVGQVSPDRLQQLLMESQRVQKESGTPSEVHAEEGFSEARTRRDRVVNSARKAQLLTTKSWILWSLHIVPAILVARCADILGATGRGVLEPAAYIGGAVACVLIYALATHWLGTWGRTKFDHEFRSRLASEGIEADDRNAFMAALSPHAGLRYYAMGFAWDSGCLIFTRNLLCYVGDEIRFTLNQEQVKAVRLGPGQPGWFPVPRIYVDWWDETAGAIRTWGYAPLMPCHFWEFKKQALELYVEFERWQKQPAEFREASAPLNELAAPAIGEVTSHSMRFVFGAGRFVKNCFWVMLLGCAAATVSGVSAMWYVCCIVLLLRVYECLPFWVAREQRPVQRPVPEGGTT